MNKIGYFLLVFLLFFKGVSSYALDRVLKLSGRHHEVSLFRDEIRKEVKIEYKKRGLFKGSQWSGGFPIASGSDIDSTLLKVEHFLNSFSIPQRDKKKILDRVGEYRHITETQCHALHFTPILGSSSEEEEGGSVKSLIGEIQKIANFKKERKLPRRSLKIGEFELEKGRFIQLRMVLDEEGHFLSFSFAKKNGEKINYKWETKGRKTFLKDRKGNALLILDSKYFSSSDGGLLLVQTRKKSDLETEKRSYIRLTQKEREVDLKEGSERSHWDVINYKPRLFLDTKRKDGVPLTTSLAQHRPVIKLKGSDVVFPQLNFEKFLKNYSPFEKSIHIIKGKVKRKLLSEYNICMAERTNLAYELSYFGYDDFESSESKDMKFCERASLSKIYRKSYLDKISNRNKNVRGKFTKILDNEFRKCLLDEEVALDQEGLYSLSFEEIIPFDDRNFSEILNECYLGVSWAMSRESLKNDQSNIVMRLRDGLSKGMAFDPKLFSLSRAYLKKCLIKNKIKNCERTARSIGNIELLSSFFGNHFRLIGEENKNEINDHGKRCLEREIKGNGNVDEGIGKCFSSIIELSGSHYSDDFFKKEMASLEFKNLEVDYLDLRKRFSLCLEDEIRGDDELESTLIRWNFYEKRCLPRALAPLLKFELKNEMNSLLSQYVGWGGLSLEDKSSLKKLLKTDLEKSVRSWESLDDLKEIRNEFLLNASSKIVGSHYLSLASSHRDDDFNKKVAILLGSSPSKVSSKVVMEEFKKKAQRKERGTGSRESVAIKTQNTISFFYAESAQREWEDQIGEIKSFFSHIPKDELSDNIRTFSKKLKKCYEEKGRGSFKGSSGKFSEGMKDCQIENYASSLLALSRLSFDKKVSSHFVVDAGITDNILSLSSDLKKCLLRYSSKEFYKNKRYRELMQGCYKMTAFDLNYKLIREKYRGYEPLLSKGEDTWMKSTGPFCFHSLLRKMARGDNPLNSYKKGDEFVNFFSKREGRFGDLEFVNYSIASSDPLIDSFISSFSNIKIDDFNKALDSCHKIVDSLLVSSFSNYALKNIPSLYGVSQNEKNREVFANFFDYELVAELLKFQKINDSKGKGLSIDLGAVVSDERIVTGELGLNALENFLNVISGLFNRGFIYDESAMRTELVIFQSELKDFLRWYNSNPNDVTIREAKEFFSQSELGEYLAMAAMSEQTYTKFTRGINQMREEEISKFFKTTNCKSYPNCFEKKRKRRGYPTVLKGKYDAIMKKYDDLLSLSREMTASYDFRRMVRPESSQGKELMHKASNITIAGPILGERISAKAENDLMDEIGEIILKDNTDGGFSERFVEIIADFNLKEEADSHWGLTKWFFYDEGDFNWDKLRKTKSGQQALNYYARFIMLPKMIGENNSHYLVNLRKEQFQKLLREAQKENVN